MGLDIKFTRDTWRELVAHLGILDTARSDETLGYLLAYPAESTDHTTLLATQLIRLSDSDYEHRSAAAVSPRGEFIARVLSQCRAAGASLVEVHTHPFDVSTHTTFSGTDWANDEKKMPQLRAAMPDGFRHATMVIGRKAFDAHYYDTIYGRIEPVHSISVFGGERDDRIADRYFPTSSQREAPAALSETLDRHQRFLGQAALDDLVGSSIAIIGLGGIGSFVACELAHLGVRELTLIDHDLVEVSNLNRLIGASPSDVGTPKVAVAAREVLRINPDVRVAPVTASFLESGVPDACKAADLLLGCLDSHGARLALNQLALQYVIPLLDAGTGIEARDGDVHMGGQVQLVLPGRGCLVCRGFIDARRASFDLASPETRAYERSHGYGVDSPAPAVISLNGVVASALVTSVLRVLAMDGTASDLTIYDAMDARMFTAAAPGRPDCAACGPEGVVGRGDSTPLPAVQDPAHSTHPPLAL